MTTHQSIQICPVESAADRRRFFSLPWQLYRGNPHWVPPLRGREKQLLGWSKHPFYLDAEIATFYAKRGRETVGRIAAIVNHAHNRMHNDRMGFFGFFECIDDPSVADALFDTAKQWLKDKGMTAWRGPVNPSMNYTCGLLVDSFDVMPSFMMPYNHAYYPALIEGAGLAQTQDLLTFVGDAKIVSGLVARYEEPILSVLDKAGIEMRNVNTGQFKQEVMTFLRIYNESLAKTWGFTPLSESEVKFLAADLQHLIVPSFAAVAEVDNQVTGSVFGLLDYNPIIKKINGRLWPFGFARMLMGQKRIKNLRVISANVLPAFHRTGIAPLLLHRMLAPGIAWGLDTVEFSWVLESNEKSANSLRRAGFEITRRHRLYEAPLA